MNNKDKAIEMAENAKQSAGHLASNIKQSDAYATTLLAVGKAKDKASDFDYSGLKVMNLFSVAVYGLLIISSYLPFISFMGASVSLNEFAPMWLYIMATLGLVSHLFGVKQLVSRLISAGLVCAIVLKMAQYVKDLIQLSSYGNHNTYSLPVDMLDFGFYVFLVALVLLLIVVFKPRYQTNTNLWNKIVQGS
ncbi:hypothetical protein DBZ36_18065 [Alginatibacterium sediminis]|uniref:Uncharacterized protein n=1 Tax=Alginatibacterium sediminis TaxID=2164068 RepID=A0A420E6X5_9ALTE|nr:hypothetical protein [Alginatibacterium sediminis]RKF13678.1 hypothetical protein DBZ36_18065 [Alginatibacterium sediminis]